MLSLKYLVIFTARKRSLGQGNIVTSVCLSTAGGGLPDRGPLDRDPPRTQTPPDGKERAVRGLLECILVFLMSVIMSANTTLSVTLKWPCLAHFSGVSFAVRHGFR